MTSALSDHLGYWLRFVSNHVSQAFARKIEARGVSVAEWVVMRELLDSDAMSPSQLANRIGMTRGAVTKLADKLIEKSLVTRTSDPNDGRAQTLALTARARRLVPELAKIADANDAEFFAHLTRDERVTLARVLRGIVEKRGLKSVPIE